MAARKKTAERKTSAEDLARRAVRDPKATLDDLLIAALRVGLERAINEGTDGMELIGALHPIAAAKKAGGKDGERSVSDQLAELFGSDGGGVKKKTVGRK